MYEHVRLDRPYGADEVRLSINGADMSHYVGDSYILPDQRGAFIRPEHREEHLRTDPPTKRRPKSRLKTAAQLRAQGVSMLALCNVEESHRYGFHSTGCPGVCTHQTVPSRTRDRHFDDGSGHQNTAVGLQRKRQRLRRRGVRGQCIGGVWL